MINQGLSFILAAILASLLLSRPAEAKLIFVGWGGEKIIKMADFPDAPSFKNGDKHFDLGYRFKQVTLFFIPVWNYAGTWCGSIPGDDSHFYDFSREQLENFANAANITLPAEASLGTWDSYGGKLLIGALALAYFFYTRHTKNQQTIGSAFPTTAQPVH
jgi:hypothetical protein